MKPPTLCNNYKTVVDPNRRLKFINFGAATCDLNYQSAVRFRTDDHVNLQLREGCKEIDQIVRTCSSSRSHAWINGSHPTTTGSIHTMEVCINTPDENNANDVNKYSYWPYDKNYCRCERKDIFFVELCNGKDGNTEDVFYVYRLFPLFKSKGNEKNGKDCILKYCTHLQRRTYY